VNYTRNFRSTYWVGVNKDPALIDPNGQDGIYQYSAREGSGNYWIAESFCAGVPAPGSSPLTSILSYANFNTMFPSRNPFYADVNGFYNAAASYPAFGNTGDTTTRKREIAAIAANNHHEGGGLYYIREMGMPAGYSAVPGSQGWEGVHPNCAPVSGQKYHGRGPIQLSWNPNYCNFSEQLYGNNNHGDGTNTTLLNNPDLLAQNPALAFRASFWYWMTQQGPSRPNWPLETSHDAITRTTCLVGQNCGFAGTVRAINGVLECPNQHPARLQKFNEFKALLGIGGDVFGKDTCQ
jgi:chitinase